MKAVIYDKWLHSLGGGEVVACNIAKILKDKGYKVLFISGKRVPPEVISEKFKIDLKGIEFKQVWNDETALKRLAKDKDLFVNISFMDYSLGIAKRNIYFVNFPTKPYSDLKGMIFSRILIPIIFKFIKPVESIIQIEAPVVINKTPAYKLQANNKYALSNLSLYKTQEATFTIYLESMYKSLLERLNVTLDFAKIVDKTVRVKHADNTIEFTLKFIPSAATAYLNINIKNSERPHNVGEEKAYLFYPKIYLTTLPPFIFRDLIQKITIRFRAGIFINILKRLDSYDVILTYSNFARKWIKRYWNKDAIIVAPPVDLLCKKYNLDKLKKKDWICSVGRFFTLGHGKKQEVMIEAFKKLCDRKGKNWELHLVGGLGDEHSSNEFFKYLRERAKGYPIFFHLNVSRQEVEDIYLKSKIYWHATGFGEDEDYHPVRFEHFGIAPIEALSAKCIPILFNGGGLKEIISVCNLESDKNLYSSVNQLVDNTIYFQEDKNRKLSWEYIFNQLDKYYSLEAFKSNFLKLLSSFK